MRPLARRPRVEPANRPQPQKQKGHEEQDKLPEQYRRPQHQAKSNRQPDFKPRRRATKAQHQVERAEDGSDVKRLGHERGGVIDEINIDGREGGGQQPGAHAEDPAADQVRQEGVEEADGHGLDDPGRERVGAEEGVDGGQVERIEKAPMRGRRIGGGHRPGSLAKGEAVSAEDAQRQGVVRNLVKGAGQDFDGVAEIEGGGEAEENRDESG
jgi:hypothetical protein